MPGISSRRVTVSAHGAAWVSIRAPLWAMSALIASTRASIVVSRKPWWSVKWPVNASSSTVILARMLRRASCASTLGLRSPGGQRGEHVSAGDTEDVGDDRTELDARVFEQLLCPLLLGGPRGHQVCPVTGQVP